MADTIYGVYDDSLINMGCVIRYATSYLLLYTAICCTYIKRTLNDIKIERPNFIELILLIIITAAFGRYTYNSSRLIILVPICLILLFLFSKHSKRALIETFALVCSIGFIIMNIKVTLDRLPKIYNISSKDKIFREQTELVTKLQQLQYDVEYKFETNITDKVEKSRICYQLTFFLYPYYTSEDRKKCFAARQLDDDAKLPFDINTTKSNITVDEILKNSDMYKCKVKYYPQHNHLNIECQKK